jgi:hypothetical protein
MKTAPPEKLAPNSAAREVAEVISGFLSKAREKRAALQAEHTALWSEIKALNGLPPPRDVLSGLLRAAFDALTGQALGKLERALEPLKRGDLETGKRFPENMLRCATYSPEFFLAGLPFELLFGAINADALAETLMQRMDWPRSDDTDAERREKIETLTARANDIAAQIDALNTELEELGLRA